MDAMTKIASGMDKKTFSSVVTLCFRNNWLNKYEASLIELLSACTSKEEVALICDLLDRFTYLTSGDRSPLWDGMANQIANVWRLPEATTQVVATTHQSDEADSAQWVLQPLKTKLRAQGWTKPTMINRVGVSIKRVLTHPTVVFVDEFIGTGKTMVKRIRDHMPQYRRFNEATQIRVCVLAAMLEGKSAVEAEGVEVHAELVLKKGISGYYTGPELIQATQHMLRLESDFDPESGIEPFHSFGYGKAEALYALDEGNATNCMFPVFWWEHLKAQKKRRPMFVRSENVTI